MPIFPENPGEPNYGVQDKLTIGGVIYTIRSSSPTDSPQSIEWDDQNGAKAGSVQFDIASTCSLAVIGPAAAPKDGQGCRFPLEVGSAFTFRGQKWQIADISEAGTYNDFTVWTIALRRWKNWPAANTVLPNLAPADGSAALPCGPVAAEPTPPAG